MVLGPTPLGNDNVTSAPDGEKIASGSILVTGDGAVEESPPVARHFTLESQKEVTIRQVAPLVLILTGATFLNVSNPLSSHRIFTNTCDRPFRLNQLSSSFLPSPVISLFRRLASNGLFRHMP